MNFIGGYCKNRGPESQKSMKKLAWRQVGTEFEGELVNKIRICSSCASWEGILAPKDDQEGVLGAPVKRPKGLWEAKKGAD